MNKIIYDLKDEDNNKIDKFMPRYLSNVFLLSNDGINIFTNPLQQNQSNIESD